MFGKNEETNRCEKYSKKFLRVDEISKLFFLKANGLSAYLHIVGFHQSCHYLGSLHNFPIIEQPCSKRNQQNFEKNCLTL